MSSHRTYLLAFLALSLGLPDNGYAAGKDALSQAQAIALQGIKNQDFRFKIIAENMTNSDSTADKPGGDPYRRKQVIFKQQTDPKLGIPGVQVKDVVLDKSEFKLEHNPGHPAADEKGMVKKPNVNRIVETVDLMTAKNDQKAMLRVYGEATSMRRLQIDLLR
jgi:flagellar basal-body rod protein FlgC